AIVETGVAHGGSIILYASLLKLTNSDGKILGIDIDIREHNKIAIREHSMSGNIQLIEGSSIAPETIAGVKQFLKDKKRIIVILDSNHTHDHVLQELEIYSKFVSPNSYLIVFDTIVEELPKSLYEDRPWGPGNNPKTAVHEFLGHNKSFEIDREIQDKLMITVAPDGYL